MSKRPCSAVLRLTVVARTLVLLCQLAFADPKLLTNGKLACRYLQLTRQKMGRASVTFSEIIKVGGVVSRVDAAAAARYWYCVIAVVLQLRGEQCAWRLDDCGACLHLAATGTSVRLVQPAGCSVEERL